MNQLALDLRNDGMRRASQAQGTEWARRAYAAIVSVAVENPTVHVDDVLARFGKPHTILTPGVRCGCGRYGKR